MAGRTKKKNKICAAGIAWAKRTFDRYPSAYANMAASKYCKDPNYAKKVKSKMTAAQKKIAKVAPPYDVINSLDFKKLRSMKKK